MRESALAKPVEGGVLVLVRRWLDVAGITDPVLRECYTICVRRSLRGRSGLGWVVTHMAPPQGRVGSAAVCVLLAEADKRVDTGPQKGRLERLNAWTDAWYAALESGTSSDPVLHAAAHACNTAVEGPPRALMEEVFTALRKDCEFAEFATYEDFRPWAEGSTGASWEWIMSTWGALGESGRSIMRDCGVLAQMVDCLADLSEDLPDGRLYLPLEDLDRFGVRREDLETGCWTEATAELLAFEVARITGGMPSLLDRARQHPWLCRYMPAISELLCTLCAVVLAAGPLLLREVAVPGTGPTVRAGLNMWRAALVD